MAEQPESIGMATMAEDGTINLLLRAESESGALGDAVISYPPSHEQYEEIRAHIGGIEVGEQKPVPPFPS